MQFESGAENVDRDARSPVCGQQNGGDDGRNQWYVDEATNSDRASRPDITGDRFGAVTPDIERAEHREQQAGHQSGLRQEMSRGPEEVDAIEEADEQRRIAERASVRHRHWLPE